MRLHIGHTLSAMELRGVFVHSLLEAVMYTSQRRSFAMYS